MATGARPVKPKGEVELFLFQVEKADNDAFAIKRACPATGGILDHLSVEAVGTRLGGRHPQPRLASSILREISEFELRVDDR